MGERRSRRHSKLVTTKWLTGWREMRITADKWRTRRIRSADKLRPTTRRRAEWTRSIERCWSGWVWRRWKAGLRTRSRGGGPWRCWRSSILWRRRASRRTRIRATSRRASSYRRSLERWLSLIAGRRSRVILPWIRSKTLFWTWPLPWWRGRVLQCAWQRDGCSSYTSITTCKITFVY